MGSSGQEVSKPRDDVEYVFPDLLTVAGKALVGAIAIAYGTGFLVLFTFFHRFEINEWGADLFRLRYIHTGLLFWLLPLSVGAPILVVIYKTRLLKLKKASASPPLTDAAKNVVQLEWNLYRALDIPAVLIVVDLITMLYLLYAFAPSAFVHFRQDRITIFLVVTLAAVIVIASVQRKVFSRAIEAVVRGGNAASEKARALRRLYIVKLTQWGLFPFLIAADYLLILKGLYVRTFVVGLLRFGAFMFLIGFLVWRTKVRIEAYSSRSMRTLIVLGSLGLIGPLYFISVLIFAGRVFPHIQVDRGGGNFCHAPLAAITFSKNPEPIGNPTLRPPMATADPGPVMVIDETEDYLFVADPFVKGAGPAEWRELPNPDNLVVEALAKSAIRSVRYFESGCDFCSDYQEPRPRGPCQ